MSIAASPRLEAAIRLPLAGALLWVTVGACTIEPPPPPPSGGADGGASQFVDTVIGFAKAGQATHCTESLPACDQPPAECAAKAVLGPNDGMTYDVGPSGNVQVAFRCGLVFERGPMPPDAVCNHATSDEHCSDELKIWSTAPPDPMHPGIVEVSLDGTVFQTLGQLEAVNQTFDLARLEPPMPAIRFVRVSSPETGTLLVDAIEGLH